MPFSSRVRFQDVHALITQLLYQNEPLRPVLVTRKRTPQFVILPLHLLRALQDLLLPYEKHHPLLTIWLIDITAFRKGILSFERTCAMFKHQYAEHYGTDGLLILIRNEPAGAMIRHERYEAVLAFLRSREVPGLDAFACDEPQADRTERELPVAAAITLFSGLPAQFAREQAQGISLPIHVTKNREPVLTIFPWALVQLIMQTLTAAGGGEQLQPLIAWWRTYHPDETRKRANRDDQPAGKVLWAAYTFLHPDGRAVTVHSLAAFADELYYALVYRLADTVSETSAQEEEPDGRVIDELRNLLVPKPEAWEKLLTFVLWDPDLLFETLEPETLPDNLLDAAHLVHTHIWRSVGRMLEERWEDAVLAAQRLRASLGVQPENCPSGARQPGEEEVDDAETPAPSHV